MRLSVRRRLASFFGRYIMSRPWAADVVTDEGGFQLLLTQTQFIPQLSAELGHKKASRSLGWTRDPVHALWRVFVVRERDITSL